MIDLFTLSTGSTEPLYRQLIEQVRRRVASGQLRPGDELPSARELAQALAVNPMTISKAFGQLEALGVLERRRGLTMVIASQPSVTTTIDDRSDLLRPILERAATEARQLQLSPQRALALFKSILETESDAP